jgi:choloylglycine hydrolase
LQNLEVAARSGRSSSIESRNELVKNRLLLTLLFVAAATLLLNPSAGRACTGITLKAADGAVVPGRTMEWGSFDIGSRVVIVPRGYAFECHMPDGKAGMSWKGKYGVVGMDAVGKDMVVDGMNEKGLVVGLFYLPGFAEYQKYDPAKSAESMGPTDIGQYLLTTCATVAEARAAIEKVRVVAVVEPALGFPAPVHFLVTEPSGKAIVIEYLKGELKIFDAPLGVITNAPSYDWHETNLRNYVNLSPVALPGKKIEDLDFKPLGGGSGMIGLPGDFTPPSRFVRAVAFSKTARPTATGGETISELFRILDNFNVPLGASEGPGSETTQGLRSATAWTSGYDTKNKIMYYHTQNNRRVRMIDLNKVDFVGDGKLVRQPMDREKKQDIEDVTPGK